MRDYLSCETLARIPEDLIALYDTEPPTDGVLIYEPTGKSS
jgi:hypothetical protein